MTGDASLPVATRRSIPFSRVEVDVRSTIKPEEQNSFKKDPAAISFLIICAATAKSVLLREDQSQGTVCNGGSACPVNKRLPGWVLDIIFWNILFLNILFWNILFNEEPNDMIARSCSQKRNTVRISSGVLDGSTALRCAV